MKKTIIIVLAVAILGFIATKTSGSKNQIAGSATAQTVSPGAATASQSSATTSSTVYKDGTFTGNAAETPYGTVQIATVINGGKITNIDFLQMPSDQGHSREITSYAEPYLRQTALSKQNASSIDFVTGATSTSYGFQESLQAALNQAATS